MIKNGRKPFNTFFIPPETRCIVPWGTHQRSFCSTTDNINLDCRNATINTDLFQHKEVQVNVQGQKVAAKQKADRKAYVKIYNLQTGGKVLCRQPRQNKLISAYDPIPYTITKINGSKITATNETRKVKGRITFFERYKSESSQRQHPKPRPSTMGRALSPSTTRDEGDQSDSDTIPYHLNSDTIPYQSESDTISYNEWEE